MASEEFKAKLKFDGCWASRSTVWFYFKDTENKKIYDMSAYQLGDMLLKTNISRGHVEGVFDLVKKGSAESLRYKRASE